MTLDARLADLYVAIGQLGARALVMGGHAVRFYGIDRTTIDYDLHVLMDDSTWTRLGEALQATSLLSRVAIAEGPSRRPAAFRRFVVGTLADGREERLELWRRNHLLAPFDELWTRRSERDHDGRVVAFLGLDDLIRSKETERDDDWRDVALLEEVSDERRLLNANDRAGAVTLLAHLRSRRGYDRAVGAGLLADAALVGEAVSRARHPVSLAYLTPSSYTSTPALPGGRWPAAIDVLIADQVRRVVAGSPRHLALVEAIRRMHRRDAMAADRADKEQALRS